MSFTFSWSPLIADTLSARELLTTALNKTPKPPIIVDDIVVAELNLGSTPPDLEILEIGDLAEDRFRGVFRMRYSGEAKIRLSTKVEGNPLRTSLEGRRQGPGRGWTDPGCLAAHSGLTIPLIITLSEFRLSGFVILVFSRQKGLTIVFRNDPLESLKVSSTFDSIPFVRDYLQRTIEERLRVLFMEDLPAILHRLSLKLWSEEYRELDHRLNLSGKDEMKGIDPLASPPQDPWDWSAIDGYAEGQAPPFSLDSSEPHATFSQKNLLRLGALTESQRTLSVFTPNIRDTVFRAWAGASERSGMQSPALAYHAHSIASVSKLAVAVNGSKSASPAASADGSEAEPESCLGQSSTTISYDPRPAISRSSSYTNFGRYRHGHKKRKHRVINLRKSDASSEAGSSDANTASTTPEPSVYPSSAPSVIYEEPINDTHPDTEHTRPLQRVHFTRVALSRDRNPSKAFDRGEDIDSIIEAPPAYTPPTEPLMIPAKLGAAVPSEDASSTKMRRHHRHHHQTNPSDSHGPSSSGKGGGSASALPLLRSLSTEKLFSPSNGSEWYGPTSSSGGILEQAWMQKMAREIARKVKEEQARHLPVERADPPPTYTR